MITLTREAPMEDACRNCFPERFMSNSNVKTYFSQMLALVQPNKRTEQAVGMLP